MEDLSFLQKQQVKNLCSTLNPHYLYLDSCMTYHQMFVEMYLSHIKEWMVVLKGNCNAGTTTSNIEELLSKIMNLVLHLTETNDYFDFEEVVDMLYVLCNELLVYS